MNNIRDDCTGYDMPIYMTFTESWIIINTTSISKLGTLLLEGVLEVMDTPGANYTLDVNFIIIRGGRLVIGTPSQPFQALANIIVRGSHSTPSWNDGEDGPTVGSKAIGLYFSRFLYLPQGRNHKPVLVLFSRLFYM